MIKIIACMDENKGIWLNWKLPWYFEEDLKRFRQQISWKTIVMWKWTFESLKNYYPDFNWHPLAGKNIILSSNLNILWQEIYKSPEEIIKKYDDIIIIWWSKTYKSFLYLATELDLTKVSWKYETDTFFPDYETDFKLISRENWIDKNLIFEKWKRK